MDIINKVAAIMTTVEGASVGIGLVIELALRFFPSAKPLSLAYVAAGIFKGVGALLTRVGLLLDKVLPQKIAQ